jgi:8-oxo-dGTP diphosphatase
MQQSTFESDIASQPQKETWAAVALVCSRTASESVLLIRRSERSEDPWSGHWSLPGGRRDLDDPDLLHTALRELAEECSVHLRRDQLRTAFPAMQARRRSGPPFVMVAPFLFDVDGELPTVLDPAEAVKSLWLRRDHLLDPARHILMSPPRYPAWTRFPAIDLDGVPLWGFTYRVLMQCWLGTPATSAPPEQHGFKVACQVLSFLLGSGLKLIGDWREPSGTQCMLEPAVVKSATVQGEIPVSALLSHFSAPGSHVAAISILEARPDYVRVTGFDFEEYLIGAE